MSKKQFFYVVTNAKGVNTIIAAFNHKNDAFKYSNFLTNEVTPSVNTYVNEVEVEIDFLGLKNKKEAEEKGHK